MKLIIVTTYDNYIDANLAVGLLESEGIASFLRDENLATILPGLNYIFGGIKLQVWENDYTKAIEILDTLVEGQKKRMKCPKCGSKDVSFIVASKPKNWISALLTYTFFIVPMGVENAYHCFSCKHEFKYIE